VQPMNRRARKAYERMRVALWKRFHDHAPRANWIGAHETRDELLTRARRLVEMLRSRRGGRCGLT